MRLFVGVPLEDQPKKNIGKIQQELEKTGGDFALIPPKNLHFTLKFLGDVDPDKVDFIKNTLKNIAEQTPAFSLTLSGLGVFPSTEYIRVIWIGVTEGKIQLTKLGNLVMSALQSIRKDDHPYEPHLTISRVKSRKNKLEIAGYIEQQVDVGQSQVDKIILYESTLTREGAVYDELGSFPLSSNEKSNSVTETG